MRKLFREQRPLSLMTEPVLRSPPDDPAGQLNARLVSYGRGPPKFLVGQPGVVSRGSAQSLAPQSAQPVSYKGSPRSGVTLSTPNENAVEGGVSLTRPDISGRSSKVARGTALLNTSTPIPFSKMARVAPLSTADLGPPPSPAVATIPTLLAEKAEATTRAAELRRDPFWFISMIRTEMSGHEFAYMNVADTEGASWDPYKLKIVAFNEVNPANHYTISEAGVTHCIRHGKQEVVEFTPLEQWETECAQFQEVDTHRLSRMRIIQHIPCRALFSHRARSPPDPM